MSVCFGAAVVLPPTHDVIKGPAGVEKFFAGLFGGRVTGHKLELIEANGDDNTAVAAAKWSTKDKVVRASVASRPMSSRSRPTAASSSDCIPSTEPPRRLERKITQGQ